MRLVLLQFNFFEVIGYSTVTCKFGRKAIDIKFVKI